MMKTTEKKPMDFFRPADEESHEELPYRRTSELARSGSDCSLDIRTSEWGREEG